MGFWEMNKQIYLLKQNFCVQGLFTQDALAHLHVNPLMLLATCVNTPIDHNVFHNLHVPVARCSASCVNGALITEALQRECPNKHVQSLSCALLN